MNNIFLLGECMIELMNSSPNTFKQSYAGDTFNTAVYLKRVFNQNKVHFITALGTDAYSENMRNYFQQENIETEFLFQSKDKIPGLYAIQTDDNGERSFTYWRENSAARQVMQHLNDEIVNQIAQGDVLFFSGISLAVIQSKDREQFWSFIKKLKAAQVQIVFDPNYRPRMWDSTEQAKQQFELAFSYADVALPGVDDFQQLYSLTCVEEIIEFLQPFDFQELIIKDGAKNISWLADNQLHQFTIEAASNVVDTTSAGDAFNGVYLGARAQGFSISNAIALAAKTAALVIQHQGAIVSSTEFQHFIKTQLTLPIKPV